MIVNTHAQRGCGDRFRRLAASIHVCVSRDDLRSLVIIAARDRTTVSAVVRRAIARELEKSS